MTNQLSRFKCWPLSMAATVLISAGMSHAAYAAASATKPVSSEPAATKPAAATPAAAKPASSEQVYTQIDDETNVTATDNTVEETISDPYEHFNRDTFAFNDFWDRNLLKPVAEIYKKIIPTPLQYGITNFFRNLNTLSTIADDILQFEFHQMANDSWRLLINSTVGIGGLFDVATRIGLPYYENDFGLVLATWGWKNSNYIVLPFYGSYTIRDGMSLPVDFFLLSAYQFIHPAKVRYGLYALSVVDYRVQALKYQDLYETAAIDKYTFVRNAYMQRRKFQIARDEQLGSEADEADVSSESGAAAGDAQNQAN